MEPEEKSQGRKPERLRLFKDWQEAISDALKRPKPPEGWPRPVAPPTRKGKPTGPPAEPAEPEEEPPA